jgi:tRNA-dihydrouridine synthase
MSSQIREELCVENSLVKLLQLVDRKGRVKYKKIVGRKQAAERVVSANGGVKSIGSYQTHKDKLLADNVRICRNC